MIFPVMKSKMKILIGGFEPFGKRETNNAWEVAKQFQDISNIDILQIPVSFKRAHQVIIDALAKKQYDLILTLGETGFTNDYVRLERLAINYKDSVGPDNDGIKANDEELVAGAPKAYFTSFPVKKAVEVLKMQGHKVKVTNSTGTFVCNSLYYHLLRHLEENGSDTIALFLHLPVATDIISLKEMEDTVASIITYFSGA